MVSALNFRSLILSSIPGGNRCFHPLTPEPSNIKLYVCVCIYMIKAEFEVYMPCLCSQVIVRV